MANSLNSNYIDDSNAKINLYQKFTSTDNIIPQNNNSNSNNLTASWINNNNNILSGLENYYTNENANGHIVNDSEINIDHLLEIELTANHQSPIDKYIDLDEIDVNPLECYRSTNNNNNNINLQNTSNANMDEFNLQFSVCSSSSSGFSEPSSFSCSSSLSSSNTGKLNKHDFFLFIKFLISYLL